MLTILWWVFLIGCFVWAAGVAYLGYVMAKDAARGDTITVLEVLEVLVWPYEFARILFIAIMVASDDSLG